jgi:hypothetical protein
MDLETRILEIEKKVVRIQNMIGEYKELTTYENTANTNVDPDQLISQIQKTLVLFLIYKDMA